MKRMIYLLAALSAGAILMFMPLSCGRHRAPEEVEEARNDSIPPLGFWEDSLKMVEGTVGSGETFAGLMTRLGMQSDSAYVLSGKCGGVFDVRRMRAGNRYEAYYQPGTSPEILKYVVYHNDKIRMTVFSCADSLGVKSVSKPVDYQVRVSEVTITQSLWNDMIRADVSPMLIVSLEDIYAWTLDFFALQEGDSFKVLYGQSVVDGEVVAIDTIYYSVFTGGGKTVPAIMFDQHDGGNIYWKEDGESLRKAFLKAPLNFSRISSGFSYHRRHPVTGRVKAHTGVDYAAPTGTPVKSIGDGTVISAGWAGGGGNQVKIRHNSVWQTAYLHLSRFAKGIKAGARVKQGEVIGYVGSTGVSTGPHLDFRVWKNGTPVNPLSMESPSADPILPENRHALDSVYRLYRHMADSLASK